MNYEVSLNFSVQGTHVHVEFVRFKRSKCSFVALLASDHIDCLSGPQQNTAAVGVVLLVF
jgi:hypothetical protein